MKRHLILLKIVIVGLVGFLCIVSTYVFVIIPVQYFDIPLMIRGIKGNAVKRCLNKSFAKTNDTVLTFNLERIVGKPIDRCYILGEIFSLKEIEDIINCPYTFFSPNDDQYILITVTGNQVSYLELFQKGKYSWKYHQLSWSQKNNVTFHADSLVVENKNNYYTLSFKNMTQAPRQISIHDITERIDE